MRSTTLRYGESAGKRRKFRRFRHHHELHQRHMRFRPSNFVDHWARTMFELESERLETKGSATNTHWESTGSIVNTPTSSSIVWYLAVWIETEDSIPFWTNRFISRLRHQAQTVDPTPGKDSVLPEVQSPTAKLQVASVPHTTNHSPTVPTNIQEYIVDS
jgi:hypothetical protein